MLTPSVVRVLGLTWVLTISLMVSLSMLTGRIEMRGLLRSKGSPRLPGFSFARAQLLLTTLGIAVGYLMLVARTTRPYMPFVPTTWLLVLGLSNGIYLSTKLVTTRRHRATRG